MGFDVFINYRTSDAAFGAAATYELLVERFGRERIFLDNQSMGPGADYPESLRAALESMRVLLVLIGPHWLADSSIERNDDWVRSEIRRALERGVPIVPVLLDGTALPAPTRLPVDVRRVLHHQAIEVRHQYLGADVDRLAGRLAEILPTGPKARWVAPHELPTDSGVFVGRAEQLARLDAKLAPRDEGPARLVVISGTAGVGKSALAVHAAHLCANRFPAGQLYVDLRGYGTERPLQAGEALAGMLRTLGVDRPEALRSTEERAARFRTLLSGRAVLVVLDNARSVDQVRPLLPNGGHTAVLVTSRHELGGLAVHHVVERMRLELFDRAQSIELFLAIIGDRVSTEPDAADLLAAHCSDLPLALRIVAERVGARPSHDLADQVAELADQPTRLDALDSGDQYSAVRTVLSWSYQALDERGASALRALGVHPGRTFDAAALTGARAELVIRGLLDAHLITEPMPGRYAMHDLLRLYAKEIADERPDERRANLRRLFDHYLFTADRADRLLTPHRYRIALDGDAGAGLDVADRTAAREWFDDECETLVALCRVDEPELDARRWQLAFVLRGYFYLTKRLDSWTETHRHALAACLRSGDHRGEALTRNNLGMALVAGGLLEDAMSHYRLAEQIFTSAGDQHGVSNSLVNQASVLRRRGDYGEALERQGRALVYYQQSGAERNAGIALRTMARVHLDAGQLAEAVLRAEEAVDVALGLGHELDIAQAFNVLAMSRHRAGQGEHAEVAARQAVEFSRRCGSVHEEARAAHRLGRLAAESGRLAEGRRWFCLAEDLYGSLGSAEAAMVAAERAGFDT